MSATGSNIDLCNTSTGTILEPVDETSESSAQPSCSINDDDHDDLLRASGAINSTPVSYTHLTLPTNREV